MKNSKFYEGLTTEQFFLANKIFFEIFEIFILNSDIKVMQFSRRPPNLASVLDIFM